MTDHKRQRQTLIDYLLHKVEIADWHGVADAAMDLRELEAEKRGRDKSEECRGSNTSTA